MGVRLVVVQPTARCNLNCSYCYVPGRQDPSKMSTAVVTALARTLAESRCLEDRVEVLWHAGEPLMAGREFFRDAWTEINERVGGRREITHTIQTNGTLINDAWCALFKEFTVAIGVSVDGPAFLHDRNRVNWADRPTHAQVLRGIDVLRRHDLAFGALCVLTDASLDYPDELIDFFLELGVPWVGFNVEEVENAHRDSSFRRARAKDEPALRQRYGTFLRRLYARWRPHAKTLEIREFADLFSVIHHKMKDPSYYRQPDELLDRRIVTVARSGAITTHSPEFAGARSDAWGNFVVGNVLAGSLDHVFTHPTYRRMRAEIGAGIRACAQTCPSFDLCGGAFTSNKFFENGSMASTETTTCILHRQVMGEVILEALIAESVARRHSAGSAACV